MLVDIPKIYNISILIFLLDDILILVFNTYFSDKYVINLEVKMT